MIIYKLEYEQQLPVSEKECWEFFSNPVNLEKITPPDMNFEIKSELPEAVYKGQIIEYKIKFPGQLADECFLGNFLRKVQDHDFRVQLLPPLWV